MHHLAWMALQMDNLSELNFQYTIKSLKVILKSSAFPYPSSYGTLPKLHFSYSTETFVRKKIFYLGATKMWFCRVPTTCGYSVRSLLSQLVSHCHWPCGFTCQVQAFKKGTQPISVAMQVFCKPLIHITPKHSDRIQRRHSIR